MFFEPVQPIRPEAAIAFEPLVDLGERRWVEAIDAALSITAEVHEAGFSQDAQVAGDSRLADGERRHEFAGAALTLAQHF